MGKVYIVSNEVEGIYIIPSVIIVPPREPVRLGHNRWILYLPTSMNKIWELIKREGKMIEAYLFVK